MITNQFDSPAYQGYKDWISNGRENAREWDSIRFACQDNEQGLADFLNSMMRFNHWPQMTPDDWYKLVDEMKLYEASQIPFNMRGNDGALLNSADGNGFYVPKYPSSCWQQYRMNLNWKEESLKDLEDATIGILRQLKKDTKDCGAVKGLVIGHVQSGKTANMEALMEMAADWGWNFFIILSGTIENLRQQTLHRIERDFRQSSNLCWMPVDYPSKKKDGTIKPMMMDFRNDSRFRYFTVCLKNKKRLQDLIDWVHMDRASHNDMRILIIDDEADQASVSNTVKTSEEEQIRKGINKLIVDLVNDNHYKPEKTNGKAQAINYVMYTATPYANFLNESTPESLYPKDFIWTLKTSDEYIGPEQIYRRGDDPDASSVDGLDIKRIVSKDELEQLKMIYETGGYDIPESLGKAICWFICAVAVMRIWNYKKPVSMLIHTSQKQVCHEALAEAVSGWICANKGDVLVGKCREVYEKETATITKEDWLRQIGRYGIPAENIRDYPDFSDIEAGIREIISVEMSHIKMNEEGDLEYHRGLHLVIDNCANNGVRNGEDYIRLAYPDPLDESRPDFATAFIIVGGSTLARGLTIEGLVSTFFLRASCQADTLMQMGRWFGYRRNYELLPRIWMTNETVEKFIFLSELETELREDLKKYMNMGVKPSEYAPRIKQSPKMSWLRLTSKKHMSNAIDAKMNFSGARPQTFVFDRDKEIQQENIEKTEAFIASLSGRPQVSCIGNCIFWSDIRLNTVLNFLKTFSFSDKAGVFNEIGKFCEWIETLADEKLPNNWSVIVAGKDAVDDPQRPDDKTWHVAGYGIGKVNRSERRKMDEAIPDIINIGVLRSLKDNLADIPEKYLVKGNIQQQDDVDRIRKAADMDKIPLLLIYRIDRYSKARTKKTTEMGALGRFDLCSECDIIGLQICIPGDQISNTFVASVTVQLPAKSETDELEDEQ